MTEADEDIVRSVLAPYETKLFQAMHGAWEDWKALGLAWIIHQSSVRSVRW